MSATNRGAVRQESDFYPTPISAFVPLIDYIGAGAVWEPACGDSRLIIELRNRGYVADGDDLQNGYDFLKDNRQRDIIVTNPPFSLAFEFCQHAVKHARQVFLLLRLNFLGSKKRQTWFQEHEPSALFVLSERPRFINNRSDNADYAWYYFGSLHRGIYHL
jgi:hypothetical protein